MFEEFQKVTSGNRLQHALLHLTPGRRYRVSIKACAGSVCFYPAYSNGVTVIPNPPKAGYIGAKYDDDNNAVTAPQYFEVLKYNEIRYFYAVKLLILTVNVIFSVQIVLLGLKGTERSRFMNIILIYEQCNCLMS